MVAHSALDTLRAIWEEVLEVDVTDIDADFFDLGGDSLLAILVANRAIESGIALPRSAVLRLPTLRQLAAGASDPTLFELG
jgi:phthiocerol/phenolphthiocerol synthesis type-I polyketide synthase E